MAEPLKNSFGTDIPKKIAAMISAVHPQFDTQAFLYDALDGYEALDLTPRGKKIAQTLHTHLPSNYKDAIEILINSLGPVLDQTENMGMTPFVYMPHVFYVADYGLNDFELSMQAQYELTQRFTAEFSIRPFLIHHPEKTLAQLESWIDDPNPHVRRLVSEGTRPRLPWAQRLPAFQKDPEPVLNLLERLKDDPVLYVRRSVANNLNDIGKDNPEALVDTARRWMNNANDERRWLVRHALRSAVKRGEKDALKVLGYKSAGKVQIVDSKITPQPVRIGDTASLEFNILNEATKTQRLLVDLRIHFVKANGKTSPKVFKLKTLELAPQQSITLNKTISFAPMTTRKHYPGEHKIELLLNGQAQPVGVFELHTA